MRKCELKERTDRKDEVHFFFCKRVIQGGKAATFSLQIPGTGSWLLSAAAPPVSGPGTLLSISSVNIPQKDC